MRIPPATYDGRPNPRRLQYFKRVRDACFISRAERASNYRQWREWYLYGNTNGPPARVNIIRPEIDLLSAYLYSGDLLRFSLTSKGWDEEETTNVSEAFTDRLDDDGLPNELGDAVTWSLAYGCEIVKVWPSPQGGVAPYLVDPGFFGVYREDVPRLSRQTAMCQRYALGWDDVFHTLRGKIDDPKRGEDAKIIERMRSLPWRRGGADVEATTGPLRVFATSITNSSSGQPDDITGRVFRGSGTATDKPEVRAPVVWCDELWIWDDALALKGRPWRLVKLVGDEILYDGPPPFVLAEQPFRKIEVVAVPGYFWGLSKVAEMVGVQEWRTQRVQDIRTNQALQNDPATFFAGIKAPSDRKFSLRRPGSALGSDLPSAKVQDFRPPVISDPSGELSTIDSQVEIQSQVNALLKGGGAKSRDEGHAMALASLASTPIKRMAMRVESCVTDVAYLSLKILRAYEKNEWRGVKFNELPDDVKVRVAAHSSSPLFGYEQRTLAEVLEKGQAIGPVEFLDMMNPPERHALRKAAIERQKAQAQEKQEEDNTERLRVLNRA